MALSAVTKSRVADGLANKASADELTTAVDLATAPLAKRTFGSIVETVTLTNAVKTDLVAQIPINAVVVRAALNLDTLVVGDASGDDLLAKVGLGIAGSVVKYGVTAALTKNSKITKGFANASLAAAETVSVYGVKTDGSTACTEKFVAGATVKVEIDYFVPSAIADA